MKAAQMLVKWWMNKETLEYLIVSEDMMQASEEEKTISSPTQM